MRVRLRFQKNQAMKFIGHLDMLRYFQKCMRRADIDIAYSEGFSPHQIMSFAAPLGVGITSEGEYIDIEVHSTDSSKQSILELNRAMVDGIRITSYKQLKETDKKAMSAVEAGSYVLTIKESYPIPNVDFGKGITEFYTKADRIEITKKTKKSERVLDIKPLIYSFDVEQSEKTVVFSLLVKTGSTDNLKPETVLEALYTQMGLEYMPLSIQIHRVDVFTLMDNQLVSLGDIGEDIE